MFQDNRVSAHSLVHPRYRFTAISRAHRSPHWDGSDGDGFGSRPIYLGAIDADPKLAGVTAYSPEQLTCLIAAYDGACAALGVARTDAAEAEAIALKVLEFARMGEFDPDRLRDYVVHAMRPGDASG